MTFLLAAGLLLVLAMGARRALTPACPRCRHKRWDRKLCAPLLFCRRCATRIDAHGRAYN